MTNATARPVRCRVSRLAMFGMPPLMLLWKARRDGDTEGSTNES